jgi:hypothetical protein
LDAVLGWHTKRNELNQTPSYDFAKQHWVLLPDSQSIYHRFGQGNENNQKFVSPDGHYEAVYRPDGTPVTDQTNGGTYNYQFDPYDGWSENIGHFFLDILPYWFFGNGAGDASSFGQRVGGSQLNRPGHGCEN